MLLVIANLFDEAYYLTQVHRLSFLSWTPGSSAP